MCLCSLEDTHLQIHRVTHDVHLHRVKVVEHITVVVVEVSHGIVISRYSLVEFLLIIHVSLLHVEDGAQHISGIESVAHPFDVAHVVLLSLLYFEMDIHIVLAERHYAVRHDDRITITQFGIFVHQILLGFLVLALYELLATEPAADVLLLVHLLEHAFLDETTLYLLLCQVVVSADVDMMNLHLILLLHIDIQYDLVGCTGILTLGDVYHSILVALVLIIPGTQNLGTVYHVGRHLIVLHQSDALLQVFTLTLLDADIVDLRDARTLGQFDVQIGRISHEAIYADGHIAEETVLPVPLHGH